MTSAGSPGLIAGLGALASRFDAYLLDQYGVLHDGQQLYPGVLDCLAALHEAGKRVLILSNSGRRKQPNSDRLARIGLPPELYDDFITSGEVAREALAEAPQDLLGLGGNGTPLRCLALGGAADRALLEGLDVAFVDDAGEADFMLLASFGDRPPPVDAFDETFAAAGERKLALVCANPDIKGIAGPGLHAAPGALAARYEKDGGRVVYIGKPHPLIYRAALAGLAPLAPGRVLAVGDSLAHDIAGATTAGLASAFVLNGIHRKDLGGSPASPGFDGRLAALMHEHRAEPDYLLPSLTW